MTTRKGSVGSKAALSVAAKLREQVALDATMQNDPKYKKYAQQVEKCLASFETMNEWPDFISFLKQLLKTLQSYTQFKEIPRKLIVSKRLSQCLIPALPSGVHQRALDVYTHILSVLGSDGLKRDLPLWSSGLFPFFEYAATNVRPVLLELFEKYYIPLQGELRPVMRSFILALLPGLEEETSETFDRVLSLLDKLSGTVSPSFFFQNIWLVMLTTQVSRSYCLSYLSRRLPRLDANEDITPIVGSDIGLMVRAFAASLGDDNLLVQRGTLDLLLTALRLEGSALHSASPADRKLLVRAATGVVLRRDLSLNRRLFAWVLGPDEALEKQEEYFNKYARDLLVITLREDMFHPSTEYAATRPFKIYVSLLDKWEIGAPLTDVLIYDSLKAIKQALTDGKDNYEDFLITANTLYEAVQPKATWKHLFNSIRKELSNGSDRTECIDMLLFALNTFRMDDDEVQKVHLPLVFSAIIEKLETLSRKEPRRVITPTFRAAMSLLEKISGHVDIVAMTGPLQLPGIAFGGSFDDSACAFYGIDISEDTGVEEKETDDNSSESSTPQDVRRTNFASAVPFISSVEKLSRVATTCLSLDITDPTHGSTSTHLSHQAFTQGMALTLKLMNLLEASRSNLNLDLIPLQITWDAEDWFNRISRPLGSKACSFLCADTVVSLAIRLHATTLIRPTPSIDSRPRLSYMMKALMNYLRPETSAYHIRAVRLIWDLEQATTNRHLESIISQMLSSSSPEDGYEAYNSFGVLWRLSDDAQLPGMHFKVPMLIVFETLKSTDPVLRRLGETWMRVNLKSYTRVVDSLLLELLDPSIRFTLDVVAMKGREVRHYIYERPFDQHRFAYLLDILLQMIKFGGQSFSRMASSTLVSRSPNRELAPRVGNSGFALSNATYTSVLIDTLLRLLQSEPKAHLRPSMMKGNVEIHSIVIDILQCIASRGDLDQTTAEMAESVLTLKLFGLVHSGRLELQNRLLHLLHSIISLLYSSSDSFKASEQSKPSNTNDSSVRNTDLSHNLSSALFVQLLIDGISIPSNRALLHHWLDFVLMTIPQFPHILTPAIFALNSCICSEIKGALTNLEAVLSAKQSHGSVGSCNDDAEFIMLLNALERLILLSLDEIDLTSTDDTADKSTSEGSGLLSIMSNVFLADSSGATPESNLTARSPAYKALHDGIGVLYATWDLVSQDVAESHPAYETLTYYFMKASARCRKVLERLYKSYAFEVIESLIEYWNVDKERTRSRLVAFEIVDFLTASAQNVVHVVCESISWRTSSTASAERSRKQVLNPELTDRVLYSFLEEYLSKLETPLALQVWPRFLTLAKEVSGNVKDLRTQVFPVLRCTTVLALKLSQTTAIDDRRVKRDLQETYGKLLDASVLLSGRSLDQGIWPRRPKDNHLAAGPLGRAQSELSLDEKTASPSLSAAENTSKFPLFDLSEQINQYLATIILPNLRKFLGDNDKVLAICNNIVYYIVNPALKARTNRVTDVEDIFITLLVEMTKLPAAVKAWRSAVADVFNDNKLFAATPKSGLRWRPIFKSLIDADKTAFSEIIGKITAAPSANIFANREYEMQMKAQNIRRVSFALFASEKNHFLAHLPAVQEKLVDLLRNGGSPLVESEVYLCVRILLCRLSPHNLSSFWPVLLSELLRVFEQVMAEPPSDGSDNLQPVLAACKLIDLLLVLQTEEFQIHQWIFITDTVDAIYRPENWFPEALLDQLSETVGDLPASSTSRPNNTSTTGVSLPDATSATGARQPLLAGVRQIDSIRELAQFFSHLSILSYEGVYASSGNVDWQAVENSLSMDLFEGR